MNIVISIDVGSVSCGISCGPGHCYLRQGQAHVSSVVLKSIFPKHNTVVEGEAG